MNNLKNYATFSIDILNTEAVNSMFSKGRARIFYKGINRNRSIIEGDVAEQLAKTIAGAPIVGVYNSINKDYEEHEDHQTPYGFVPLEPNITWVDYGNKGLEKTYLEVDVIIWDKRFEGASLILEEGKSLSMELNPNTIKGTWEKIDNQTYFRCSFAEFYGITILGDNFEPCFEDAAFYTEYANMIMTYSKHVEDIQKEKVGGTNQMNFLDYVKQFRLSFGETAEGLELAYAAHLGLEGDAVYDLHLMEVYSDYAVIRNWKNKTLSKVSYSVEDDKVVIGETTPVLATYITIEEKEALDALQNNFSTLETENTQNKEEIETLKTAQVEFENQVTTLTENIAVLKAEKLEQDKELAAAQEIVAEYTKNKKQAVIDKFSTKLENAELIAEVTEKMDSYTYEDITAKLSEALTLQVLNEVEDTEVPGDTNFTFNLPTEGEGLKKTEWELVQKYKGKITK